VLGRLGAKRPETLIGASLGVDAAAVAIDADWACVLTTDPITTAATGAGRLAVHVVCNDLAAMGAEPGRDFRVATKDLHVQLARRRVDIRGNLGNRRRRNAVGKKERRQHPHRLGTHRRQVVAHHVDRQPTSPGRRRGDRIGRQHARPIRVDSHRGRVHPQLRADQRLRSLGAEAPEHQPTQERRR